jgi:hypothetical protein
MWPDGLWLIAGPAQASLQPAGVMISLRMPPMCNQCSTMANAAPHGVARQQRQRRQQQRHGRSVTTHAAPAVADPDAAAGRVDVGTLGSGPAPAERTTDAAAAEAVYANFDWRNQWYPVAFAKDMPEGATT